VRNDFDVILALLRGYWSSGLNCAIIYCDRVRAGKCTAADIRPYRNGERPQAAKTPELITALRE